MKGGYDFIGEDWAADDDSPEPDPNPIDTQGHGSHVADIAAGRSADGSHLGIAPGAGVYALKVCSAVATSCSGVALLEALDWALDPNGDKDISDAVDIVNMSLGSNYGQAQDDLSVAVNNIVRAGVVVVASAGNAADRPFIVGSPSTAERAISVAQTALPDDKLYTIAVNSPTIRAYPATPSATASCRAGHPLPPRRSPHPWRAGDDRNWAAPPPRSPASRPARWRWSSAVPAPPPSRRRTPRRPAPPRWSSRTTSPAIRPTSPLAAGTRDGADPDHLPGQRHAAVATAAGPVQVTIDPAATTTLTNTVVGTSSRGLAISGLRAKPDIGAPGAWLSAEVGTGGEETNFSGTSGAAPVVTGAAALVLDRHPNATPAVVKARLLNGASMDSRTPDADAQLYPTPISRIGAGEVRIAPAVDAVGVAPEHPERPAQAILGLGMPQPDRPGELPGGAPGPQHRTDRPDLPADHELPRRRRPGQPGGLGQHTAQPAGARSRLTPDKSW